MRFWLKGFRPAASASAIRKRFKSFLTANVAFIASWPVVGALSQTLFSKDVAAFVAAPPIMMLYIWCCIGYGRLARCFGQKSLNFTIAALFLYPYEMVVAYFAFGHGIREAFNSDGAASEGEPLSRDQ